MFRFIKGLFRKEEEIKQIIEEIPLDSLQVWTVNKRKNIDQEISKFLVSTRTEFEAIVSECKTAIIALRNANLLNPKIPENEKILMEGNRDSFTKSAERLLAMLSYPDAGNLDVFFESSDNAFKTYEKMSLRPFAILQHFFEHESKAVHSCVHRLFLLVSKIKEFQTSSGILNALSVEREAKEIIGAISLNKEKEKNLADINLQLEQKEKLIHGKDELIKSQEFLDFAVLLHKKEEIIKSINEADSELESIFASLKVPLQKLVRIHPDFAKKIAIFDNFKDALPEKDAEVIVIISALKKEIENNSLDLKDKKKEIALQKAGLITKDFLDSWNNKRIIIAASLKSLEHEIMASDAREKQEIIKREIDSLMASKRELEQEKISILKKHSAENLAKRIADFESKNRVRIFSL
ncbi:MAG: hypothetical protein AABX51_00795 [Nanoarchaeota archaeon]